jgi:Family of unknown function (DUF5686)
LTEMEQKGYRRIDSLKIVNAPKLREDSIKALPKFKASHLLWGHSYNYGKSMPGYGYPESIKLGSPLMGVNYNTVEGYLTETSFEWFKRLDTNNHFMDLNLKARWAITRGRLHGLAAYSYWKPNSFTLSLVGGNYIFQINGNDPIRPLVNGLYSLLLEQNFMKIYEKSFVQLRFVKTLGERITLGASGEVARRINLQNWPTAKPFFDSEKRTFTSNDPENRELSGLGTFTSHNATILNFSANFRPWAKAFYFNGNRFRTNNGSPSLSFNYQLGLGDAQFSQWMVSLNDVVEIGARGKLSYLLRAGGFPQKPNYFLDFKHFNGNQTIVQRAGVDNFRLLDYYFYSTADTYFQGHVDYSFRQLLFTRIPALQLAGMKENLFVNYLHTKVINYTELGYGFDGIFMGLGFELIGAFRNGKYESFGARILMPF